MTWWAGLIIGVLAAIVVVLLFIKLRSPSGDERAKLADVKLKERDDLLKLEQEKAEKLAALAKEQQEKLKLLTDEYEKLVKEIDDDKAKDFKKYLDDTVAAGAALDELLGIGPRDPKGSSETG